MLVGIAQAPFIMGLSDGVMKTDIQYRLITESDCTGYHLPASQTINIIEECQLWREAFVGWHGKIPCLNCGSAVDRQ